MVEIKLHSKVPTLSSEISHSRLRRRAAWSGLVLSGFLAAACAESSSEPKDDITQELPPCSEQVEPPNCTPESPDATPEPVDVCQALGNIASALNHEPIDINGVAENIQSLADGGMDTDPAIEPIIINFGALNPSIEDETLVIAMQDSVSAAQNSYNC